MKASLPEEFWQWYRRKKGCSNSEFDYLLKYPRYTNTEAVVLGKTIILPDAASFLYMYNEIFIQEIYKFKTESKNPYIIDAGANIGLSTIYFKNNYPNSKIVAFEPDNTIFEFLKGNLEKFNFGEVSLINKGLWDDDCYLNFNSEGADAGAITSIDNRSINSQICVTSLRNFITSRVDFLKMDIEGAEYTVLNDIRDSLHFVDNIFVEYHSFIGVKQNLAMVLNILEDAGFRIYTSNPGNKGLLSPLMGYSSYNNMDFQLNIFGIRTA